jgi:hypothetical protein
MITSLLHLLAIRPLILQDDVQSVDDTGNVTEDYRDQQSFPHFGSHGIPVRRMLTADVSMVKYSDDHGPAKRHTISSRDRPAHVPWEGTH